MAVENLSLDNIDGLNTDWPRPEDPMNQGDDHMRLIKSVLKKQFPSWKVPLVATAEQINQLAVSAIPSPSGFTVPVGKTATINGSILAGSGATIDGGGNVVKNFGTPVAGTDAANKAYVDSNFVGKNATSGDVSVSGNLTVAGKTTFAGGIAGNTIIGDNTNNANLTVNGTIISGKGIHVVGTDGLLVESEARVSGNLTVGSSAAPKTVDITGPTTIHGTLGAQNTTINGTLDVGSTATMAGIQATAITGTGLTVNGAATITGHTQAANIDAAFVHSSGDMVVGTTGGNVIPGTLYVHGREYVIKNHQYKVGGGDAIGWQTNGMRVGNQGNSLFVDYQLYEARGQYHECSWHLAGGGNDNWLKVRSNGQIRYETSLGGGYFAMIGSNQTAEFFGDANLRGAKWDGTYLGDFLNSHYAPASDIRLKKDITDSKPGALSRIEKINTKEFNWKSEFKTPVRQRGFIAQDLEKIDPSYVYETKMEDGTAQLNYAPAALIADLIDSVKELKAEIAALKAAAK